MRLPFRSLIPQTWTGTNPRELERIAFASTGLRKRLEAAKNDVIDPIQTRVMVGETNFSSVKLAPGDKVPPVLLAKTAISVPCGNDDASFVIHRANASGTQVVVGQDFAIGVHDLDDGIGVKWFTGGTPFYFADILPNDPSTLVALSAQTQVWSFWHIPRSFTSLAFDRVDDAGLRVFNNPPFRTVGWDPALIALKGHLGLGRWVLSHLSHSSEAPTFICSDLWSRDKDGVVTVAHTKIDGGRTQPETVHMGSYNDLTLDNDDVPYSMTFPDSTRMMWWEGDSTIEVHVSLLEVQKTTKKSSVAGALELLAAKSDSRWRLNWQKYSFDPFMGRAAVIQGKQLRILDFVGEKFYGPPVDPEEWGRIGGMFNAMGINGTSNDTVAT
ncbi:hypothetical protein DL96DRAFT_1551065 [Flagelloscypha sp. PMI_526]|nr:hypothetical protein DL96DRAFT_1551065 [Flagelloscypha sp. PMI_526]